MAEGETRGAYRTDSIPLAAPEPTFWFLRPFFRIGLPAWVGALVLTAIAFGGVSLLDWFAVGSLGSYDTMYLPFHLAYFSLTSIWIGRQTERILSYAGSLGAVSLERMRRTLYSTRWACLVAVPIEAVYVGSVLMRPGFVIADLFRYAVLLGVFHILVGASAVWAFGYAMKALYDVGRAPLSLKPFTEDGSLGLRPFGGAALRLVATYEIAILVAAIPMIIGAGRDPMAAYLFAVLGFLGVLLFFVPLLSFGRQMRAAKARELAWIGPRYEELVKAVRESHSSHVDEEVVGSLSALDKIHRDVQAIHTWPFDEAIVVRLASLTVLPLTVAVLARAVMILTLHV